MPIITSKIASLLAIVGPTLIGQVSSDKIYYFYLKTTSPNTFLLPDGSLKPVPALRALRPGEYRKMIVVPKTVDELNDLIKTDLNINQVDRNGSTLLMLVDDLSMVQILLDRGSDITIETENGKNVIDYAEERGLLDKIAVIKGFAQTKKINFISSYKSKIIQAERDAAEKRRAFLAKTIKFRKTLKPGDETSYGMVIEVKRPLVKIQTTQYVVTHYTEWVTKYNQYGSYKDPQVANQSNPVPVEKWFKIEDVYPLE